MNKIKLGIYGYGNIAKGAEKAILKNTDFSLEAVFTRRDPAGLAVATPGAAVVHVNRVLEYKDKIDVMLLCGGSATDLPVQGPELARFFNTVDTFDTHAKIPAYLQAVDSAAKQNQKTAVISTGWDPGLFSMLRAVFSASLPEGKDYTFWGPGVSQGHSDAIRRVEGVANAIQYTVPVENVLAEVRNGSHTDYTTRQKHKRECYVVAKDGADRARIEKTIKEMPNYFADYDTTVHFITEDELKRNHGKMAHGGFVFRNGKTSEGENHVLELSIKLSSNPEFTASVMVAFARAAFKLAQEGSFGAKTVLDIPLAYLSPKGREELIKELL